MFWPKNVLKSCFLTQKCPQMTVFYPKIWHFKKTTLYPLTLFHKQAQKFIAGVVNPGGFISSWTPICETLCKWFVARYHSDESRKVFLDKYLLHLKICLDRCIELSCAELPGMNQILREYTTNEFEIMHSVPKIHIGFYRFFLIEHFHLTFDRKGSFSTFNFDSVWSLWYEKKIRSLWWKNLRSLLW